MLWAVLLACTHPDPAGVPAPDDSAASHDSAPPDPLDSVGGDTGWHPDTAPEDTADSGPTVTEESVPDQPADASDTFFDDSVIHDIAITLPGDSVAALDAAPYSKAPGSITIDGTTLPDVGVRLRGKIGSYRTLSGKPKFAVDLNFTHADQRYYGVEELSLNNEVADCSYMKEPLSYKIMREAGVPAGRTSFARVTVNGLSYGLYVVVETPDDRFLAHNFSDPSGNLYDGKYIWYGGYSYTLLDFYGSLAPYYQLEEGTDVGNADIWDIARVLGTPTENADWYTRVDSVVDLHAFTVYMAVEELIGHNDGYAMNTNNYRVYFDPANRGRAQLIPWDFDNAYLHDYEWGFSWASPSGRLAYACLHNADCLAEYKASMTTLLDDFDAAALQSWYDDRVALITDDAEADPRRECSQPNVLYYQSVVRGWLGSEPAAIRSTWGL